MLTNSGSVLPSRWLAVWLLSFFLPWPLTAAEPVTTPVPTISIDEVERGQRGYGLTVFSGTTPERFEVEVIGVMRNTSPDRSWILARLSGQDLERIGVAQGMSGSPVYIDGRLAGAVAFGWGFSQDPIAGITPIEEMRALAEVGELPAGGRATAGFGGAGPPLDLAAIAGLDIPQDLLQRQLEGLRPRLFEGASSSLQWSAAGFEGAGRDLLATALGGLSPSGRMAAPADGETFDSPALVAGGPVAIVLVDGDLHIAATGTVTDTDGDRIYALGHPLLGLGPVDLPMARAEVVTMLPSLNTSFKISNQGPVVGAFRQDREAGMLGIVGAEPPMIPVTLTVRGAEERTYRVRVAELAAMTPSLIGASLLGALQTASFSRGEQAVDLRAQIRLRGYSPLVVEQSFDGGNAPNQAAGYLLSIVGYLMQNVLEVVEIEEIEVVVDQLAAPRTATLVGAYADRSVVHSGERVRLNLEFLAYRGEPFRHSIELQLPEKLPQGRYSIMIGDGPTIDAIRMEAQAVVPRRFPGALELMRGFHSRRDLVALGLFSSPGLAVVGQSMARLPGSMRSLLASAGPAQAVPLQLVVAQEVSERLDFPFSGGSRIDFVVERRQTDHHSEPPAMDNRPRREMR